MVTYPPTLTGDVLVLGAGFSRAVAASMPLTDDLGNDVLARVIERSGFALPRTFTGGQFEVWLSRLAEDQPDLSTAENARHRYIFELCAEELAEVLSDHVADVADQARATPWLIEFLHALHARQATVVTFNQDVLVELAVGSAHLAVWDPRYWPITGPQPIVGWQDTLGGQPPLPGDARYQHGPPLPTFRLLKLHGSLNWYWRPDDVSGATTATWFLPGELDEQQALPDERTALARELPGRVPLIVPPSAGKTSFYRSPLLTKLWQDARSALSACETTVSLLGYSLPQTDLVTVGMLRDTIGDQGEGNGPRVTVVNPTPAPVVANLETAAQVDGARIGTCPGVTEFANRYIQQAAEDLVAALRDSLQPVPTALLLAGTSVDDAGKVSDIHRGPDGDLDLILMREEAPYAGTNRSADTSAAPCNAEQLRRQLEDTAITRLRLLWADGSHSTVLGAADYRVPSGAGNGTWQVLVAGPKESGRRV